MCEWVESTGNEVIGGTEVQCLLSGPAYCPISHQHTACMCVRKREKLCVCERERENEKVCV